MSCVVGACPRGPTTRRSRGGGGHSLSSSDEELRSMTPDLTSCDGFESESLLSERGTRLSLSSPATSPHTTGTQPLVPSLRRAQIGRRNSHMGSLTCGQLAVIDSIPMDVVRAPRTIWRTFWNSVSVTCPRWRPRPPRVNFPAIPQPVPSGCVAAAYVLTRFDADFIFRGD